jgi:hypothetical protein
MVHQSEVELEFQPMAERRRAESPKKIKRDPDDQTDNPILKFPFAGDDMRSVQLRILRINLFLILVGQRDPEAECSRLRIESNEVGHLSRHCYFLSNWCLMCSLFQRLQKVLQLQHTVDHLNHLMKASVCGRPNNFLLQFCPLESCQHIRLQALSSCEMGS